MAYTYLIGWAAHNKYYYGVRFAENCEPKELMNTYFTSSKHVKLFIELNGLPDIIEIRKTFENKDQARLWESKVLKRLNVTKNEKWLNRTDNKAISYERSEKQLSSFSTKMKGRKSPFENKKHSDTAKLKISEARKGKPTHKGPNSNEWKQNISNANKGRYVRPRTEKEKQKQSKIAKDMNFGAVNIGKIWVCNKNSSIRIYSSELQEYFNLGYIRGRKFPT